MLYTPETTIRYKTYIKRSVVEAFKGVFEHHKDELLSGTNVTIEYPRTDAEYPTLLIRFFEKDIQNMGVGHQEHIHVDGPDGKPESEGIFTFKHYLYHADIEYAIYALSSLDRDLIADTVVQTLGMGTLEAYTNRFFERIYPDEQEAQYPDSIWHFININTDMISGFGETQTATPWQSEDDLIYSTSYRTSVMGEFYSVPPNIPKEYISKVLLFPYIGGLEEVPQGESGGDALWEPPSGE